MNTDHDKFMKQAKAMQKQYGERYYSGDMKGRVAAMERIEELEREKVKLYAMALDACGNGCGCGYDGVENICKLAAIGEKES